VQVFTVGFTQKKAATFFGLLKRAGVRRLIDVRLNNVSQLAGFAKRDDLAYFLRELAGIEYVHEPLLAPTQQMLDAYKKHGGDWAEYAPQFLRLLAERRVDERLERSLFAGPSVLLCSEPTADQCHRRLVVEFLREKWGDLEPVHL
jgi:uncharacterized protein (DUF488 family)